MKAKIKFIAIMCIVALSIDYAQANDPIKGNGNTEFGDYSISLSDSPSEMKGKNITSYDLTYNNINQRIVIAMEETKKCRNFVVKYSNFEVQYVCTKEGFGVRRIENKFSSIHPAIVNSLMDEKQFACQQRILNEAQSTEELLHIIAGYFPYLIKSEVRSIKTT